VPVTNEETLSDLPRNCWYIKRAERVAGDKRQDIVSLCLLVMSYEMGIRSFEKLMTSNDNKKRTVKDFIVNPLYDENIRNLVKVGVEMYQSDVNINFILDVVMK
jgi:hypothetical protein